MSSESVDQADCPPKKKRKMVPWSTTEKTVLEEEFEHVETKYHQGQTATKGSKTAEVVAGFCSRTNTRTPIACEKAICALRKRKNKNVYVSWTPDKLAVIKGLLKSSPKISYKAIAARVNAIWGTDITVSAIQHQLRPQRGETGRRTCRRWTELEDKEVLKSLDVEGEQLEQIFQALISISPDGVRRTRGAFKERRRMLKSKVPQKGRSTNEVLKTIVEDISTDISCKQPLSKTSVVEKLTPLSDFPNSHHEVEDMLNREPDIECMERSVCLEEYCPKSNDKTLIYEDQDGNDNAVGSSRECNHSDSGFENDTFDDIGEYTSVTPPHRWQSDLAMGGLCEAPKDTLPDDDTQKMEIGPKLWRSILFAVSAVFPHWTSTTVGFLHSLSVYGSCGAKHCPLTNTTQEAHLSDGQYCRHRLYLEGGYLYRGKFSGVGDYRLVMALYCHLDARNSYHEEKNRDVLGVSGRVTCWYPVRDCIQDDTWRSIPEVQRSFFSDVALIKLSNVDGGEIKPYSFGYLQSGREFYNGITMPCAVAPDCIWILVPISDIPATPISTSKWFGKGNIMQQVNQFKAVDAAVNDDLLYQLAERETRMDTSVVASPVLASTEGYSSLNAQQKKAACMIVEQEGVIPIVGPCGCGKTNVIAVATTAYVRKFPTRRVAICASTNFAVDENLHRLVEMNVFKETELLRVGTQVGERTMKEPLRRFWLEYLLENHREQIEEQASKENTRDNVLPSLTAKKKYLLKRARVILSTCSSLGREDLKRLGFDICIVDEAEMTCDPALLLGVRKSTKALVQIGDFRQLPPHRARDHDTAMFSGFGRDNRLDKCALEDYFYAKHMPAMICFDTQYRCHRDMMDILQMFYDDTIKTGRKCDAPGLLRGFKFRPRRLGLQLFEERVMISSLTHGYEKQDGGGLYNMAEVFWIIAKIQEIAIHIKGQNPQRKTMVLVISPYRKQLELLKRYGMNYKWRWENELAVDWATADSCIGRDVDIVLISLVRSERIGFLNDSKRMLTMLSRAKEYMFIVAYQPLLEKDQLWTKVLTRAKPHAMMFEDRRHEDEIYDSMCYP